MILAEASMKELVARRDELHQQAQAINREIARRAHEELLAQHQQRNAEVWERLKPRPMLQRGAM